MISPSTFLETIAEHTKQADPNAVSVPRLGTVDPAYVSGAPKVTLEGTTVLSPAGFPRLSAYTPAASDRVLLLPVGSSYVILGKVL